MKSSAPDSPSFDSSARIFSLLFLLVALGVLFIRFLPTERGVQFGTHLLLWLGLLAEFALLLLLAVIALVLRLRGRLRYSRFSTLLSAVAVVGLVVQFYAVQTMHIDGSSVP